MNVQEASFACKKGFQCYRADPLANLMSFSDDNSTSRKVLTRNILSDLNSSYQERFSCSFSESAIEFCGRSENIEKKRSRVEKQREKRKIQRSITSHVNTQLRDTAAMSFLSEKESMNSYQRKRLFQSFEKPDEPRAKRSHIPQSGTVDFDVEKLLQEIVPGSSVGLPLGLSSLSCMC